MMQLICRNDIGNCFSYTELDNDRCAVTGFVDPCAAPIRLVIPDHAPDGRLVTAVADNAFSGCTSPRVVCLPDGVTSIGKRAFAFCTSLSDIRIGRESHLSSIGDRAFMSCERLPLVRLGHLSDLRAVGTKAFAYCTRLRSVVLPDSLPAIPDGMFEGCRILSHVRLPGRLIRIGGSAFSACGSLASLYLPDSVGIIEDNAFGCCALLSCLTLPASPCLVSASAFRECPSLPGLSVLLGAS